MHTSMSGSYRLRARVRAGRVIETTTTATTSAARDLCLLRRPNDTTADDDFNYRKSISGFGLSNLYTRTRAYTWE